MGLHSFNYISICSGGGGLDLGLHLACGVAKPVVYVENEAFAIEVLASRMEEGLLGKAPVWSDIRTFDGRPWRGLVQAICGGYPCQPWSFAGKRLGKDDPRHLWPQIARIISEAEPNYCFFENVEGHLSLGFKEVRAELRDMGFRVEAGLFSAAEVGATHLRKRLFILAAKEIVLADSKGMRGAAFERDEQDRVLQAMGQGVHGHERSIPVFPPRPDEIESWKAILVEKPELEPAVFDMADESAAKLDRSKEVGRISQFRILGNGVVPAVAALAFTKLLTGMIDDHDSERG